MTKRTKSSIRNYSSKKRGAAFDRQRTQSNARFPDPISAHTDAIVTFVGKNFSDYTTWGVGIRLALVLPPKSTAVGAKDFTLGDCLNWLESLSRSLADSLEEGGNSKLYRMLATLEGTPNRGWFYTIVFDLPQVGFSLQKIKDVIQSTKPIWFGFACLTECDGVVETSHTIGRLGLSYLTEGT